MQYDKDMDSPHKVFFLEVRAYLLSTEGMDETRKDRITTYSYRGGGVCHVRTMPHGIDVGFLKGARMKDKLNRLTGDGKAMRVLPMAVFDRTALDYYIPQAVELARPKSRGVCK